MLLVQAQNDPPQKKPQRGVRVPIRCHASSHQGGREHNEDTAVAQRFSPGENLWGLSALVLVADGMGGAERGKQASELAAKKAMEFLAAKPEERGKFPGECFDGPFEGVIEQAIHLANSSVFTTGGPEGPHHMGTTLTLVALKGDTAYIGHVGDSRAYRLTRQGVEQITTDHTYVQTLVDAGQMTPEEAKVSPQRNVITRTVGTRPETVPDVMSVPVTPDTAFMVCSDGLTDVMDDADVEREMRLGRVARDAVERLVDLAVTRETTDNASAAILDIGHAVGRPRAIRPTMWLVLAAALLSVFMFGYAARMALSTGPAVDPAATVPRVIEQGSAEPQEGGQTDTVGTPDPSAIVRDEDGQATATDDIARPLRLAIRAKNGELQASCGYAVTVEHETQGSADKEQTNVETGAWQVLRSYSGPTGEDGASAPLALTVTFEDQKTTAKTSPPVQLYRNNRPLPDASLDVSDIETLSFSYPPGAADGETRYAIRLMGDDLRRIAGVQEEQQQ